MAVPTTYIGLTTLTAGVLGSKLVGLLQTLTAHVDCFEGLAGLAAAACWSAWGPRALVINVIWPNLGRVKRTRLEFHSIKLRLYNSTRAV